MYLPMNNNFELTKELLTQNGKITGLAYGNSMKPLLRHSKDNAVIIPITKPLKKNDVVLYRRPNTNELILHRIIKLTPNGFVIRGDNVYYTEYSVNTNDIVGVLEGFYRNKKYYECENNIFYKLYTLYIRLSYPIRLIFFKVLRKLKYILTK